MERYMYLVSSRNLDFLHDMNQIFRDMDEEDRPRIVATPFLEPKTIAQYDMEKNLLKAIGSPYSFVFIKEA